MLRSLHFVLCAMGNYAKVLMGWLDFFFFILERLFQCLCGKEMLGLKGGNSGTYNYCLSYLVT